MPSTLREPLRRAVDVYLRSRALRTAAVLFLLWLTYGLVFGDHGIDAFIPYRIDFDVYRIGGQVFRDGGDLYGRLPDTQIGENLPFTYPPLAAALFSVFTYLPFDVGSVLFSFLTVGAMLGTVWLVLRDLGRSRSDAAWLTVLLGIVAVRVMPLRETIDFGQINAILMVLVALDLLAGRGKWWRGILVGLALSIKLTPAVFLAYFLMRRDWQGLVVGVVSALGWAGLGFALAPADSLRYWTGVVFDPSRIGGLAYHSNQSVNGMLHRLGVESSTAWFLLCAVIGLACLALMHRLFRRGHDAMAATVMGLYALIASPVSWSHHWVWAVPAIIIFTCWALYRTTRGWAALLGFAVLGALIFLYAPHWMVQEPETTPHWNAGQHLVGNAYLWWVLAALVVAWFCPRGVVDEVESA